MSYPRAYIEYLVYFHGFRDYFECHEVLEEFWKKPSKEDREKHWVGLIQIAVSLYHQRRGNFSGAIKLMKNAIRILEKEKMAIESLSLHHGQLLLLLRDRYHDLLQNKRYTSFDLPINSQTLIERCKQKCDEWQCTWGEDSDLANEYIVHKHKLRDRREVIEEREFEKKIREARSQ